MKAATAGEYLRPRTVMRLMVRLTAGSTNGRRTLSGWVTENSGMKAKPIFAITMACTQSSRSERKLRVKLDSHVCAHAHDHLAHFARQAVDVRLAGEVAQAPTRCASAKRMLRRQQHHIALGVQRFGAVVLAETVQRVEDRDIEFVGIELRGERLGRTVAHRGVDAGRILLKGREQAVETHRSNSRHHAKADRHLVEQPEVLGDRLGRLRLLQDLAQMRLHPPPELSERDLPPLAMEQRTAELRFELLDRRGEGRL